ncbi:SagB family peptide dehydrogenase [Kitasatospora sp. NPDC008050]|uniref:SagB family peptide dehydrogenase n=1 Tax=Kitasatospora sp. NPDC008050 TaxID=3364021 RepID=UPI0036E15436
MRIDSLAAPQLTELWSLRTDTLIEGDAVDGTALDVHTRWGLVHFAEPSPELREALRRMQLGPVSLRNVLPGFPAEGKPGAAVADPRVRALQQDLDRLRGVVVRSLAYGGMPLLSVVPVAKDAVYEPMPVPPGRRARLSRFAVLRYAEGGLRLESPVADHRVELHRPEAAWLVRLLDGSGPLPRFFGEQVDALPAPLVAQAVGHLVGAGVAVLAAECEGECEGGPQVAAEDEDPHRMGWSPDDLMTHTGSRLGRHDRDFGTAGSGAPAAGPGSPAPIALFRPDLTRLAMIEPAFTEVLEARRSVCDFGPQPLTLRQIGELLFRAARSRTPRESSPGEALGRPRGERPQPGTGAVYALEVYLVVGAQAELAPGCYHYDPYAHRLQPLQGPPDAAEEMLTAARAAADSTGGPPLLIVFTAHFRRVMHAFSGLAYASLLKEVGILLQNFYLVTTAMGLGGCALAAGDSRTAVRAFGLEWPIESSVGEFVVGTLPAPLPAESGVGG